MAEQVAFDDIVADFDFLEDWDDRYKYLIDLGRQLVHFPEQSRIEANKVRGCASQVWLTHKEKGNGADATLHFQGDSDAHIVKGLVAVLLALYSGKTRGEILALDERAALKPLDLDGHITPQRSNGLASMIKRIKETATEEAAQ